MNDSTGFKPELNRNGLCPFVDIEGSKIDGERCGDTCFLRLQTNRFTILAHDWMIVGVRRRSCNGDFVPVFTCHGMFQNDGIIPINGLNPTW